MKKQRKLSLFLALVLILSSLCVFAALPASAAAWDGTTANVKWFTDKLKNGGMVIDTEATYEIKTAEDLFGLSMMVSYREHFFYYSDDGKLEGHYPTIQSGKDGYKMFKFTGRTLSFQNLKIELANDIDLGGKPFMPLGTMSAFGGKLDGKGHTVKNLYVNNDTAENVMNGGQYCWGFVGSLAFNGEVKNLKLENVVFDVVVPDDAQMFFVGGVVGKVHEVDGGTVSDVTVNGLTINLSADDGVDDKTEYNPQLGAGIGAVIGQHNATSAAQVHKNITVNDYQLNDNFTTAAGRKMAADASMVYGKTTSPDRFEMSSIKVNVKAAAPETGNTGSESTKPSTTDKPGTGNAGTGDATVALLLTAVVCSGGAVVLCKKRHGK